MGNLDSDRIREKDLTRGLSKEDKRLFAELGHRRHYRKNAVIYSQGDPPGETYIVESGMIRTYFVSPQGREFTKGFWTAHDVVGRGDIFGDEPRVISAEAITASVLIAFNAHDLAHLITRIPRFAQNLIADLASNIRSMTTISDWLGTQPVRARVALVLLTQSEWHGRRTKDGLLLLNHLSHQDVAHLVGATRQWVTQTLSDFEKERLIECKTRSILLLNEKKLELLAQFYLRKPSKAAAMATLSTAHIK